MIHYSQAQTEGELLQILELQQKNLPTALSSEEKRKEGFVTVHHSLELLRQMNDVCKHTLAISQGSVVGYALSMAPQFKDSLAVLIPMFQEIEQALSQPSAPKYDPYLVMGQICIDKPFRQQGIFRGLYEHMQQFVSNQYPLIITEVDQSNTRSLQAHYAVGFKILSSYQSGGQHWELIYLE